MASWIKSEPWPRYVALSFHFLIREFFVVAVDCPFFWADLIIVLWFWERKNVHTWFFNVWIDLGHPQLPISSLFFFRILLRSWWSAIGSIRRRTQLFVVGAARLRFHCCRCCENHSPRTDKSRRRLTPLLLTRWGGDEKAATSSSFHPLFFPLSLSMTSCFSPSSTGNRSQTDKSANSLADIEFIFTVLVPTVSLPWTLLRSLYSSPLIFLFFSSSFLYYCIHSFFKNKIRDWTRPRLPYWVDHHSIMFFFSFKCIYFDKKLVIDFESVATSSVILHCKYSR